ncbi:MAG: hypothetical protein LAN37_16210 [Acidobacteriia bacterium]|nr:hypothetical protein [Terriglobia bacterium]
MTWRHALTLLLFSVFLSGCAALRQHPKLLPWNSYRDHLVQKYSKDTSWYDDYTKVVGSDSSPEKTVAKAARNQILYELIWLVDDRYADFENAFNTGTALYDTASDVTNLGLTSAASVVNPANTKSILAAVATVVSGSNGKVNNNFFQNKTRPVLIGQMRADRQTALLQLTNGMALPFEQFSLEQGLVQVQAYFYTGTIVSALAKISQDAGSKAKGAEDKMQSQQQQRVDNLMRKDRIELEERELQLKTKQLEMQRQTNPPAQPVQPQSQPAQPATPSPPKPS